MEAIILAGGFGRRLQGVVSDVPKPMADINGKPFLSYILAYLSCQGVEEIILSVGYRHEIIKKYFGIKYNNMFIEYVTEVEPLGTGGAVREALRHVRGDDVIILNGDTLFTVDMRKMIDMHRSDKAAVTMALKPLNNFDRYGVVVQKDGRVTAFEEKSFRESGYINGGIYVMNKAVLKSLEHYERCFSFEKDFLQKKLDEVAVQAFIAGCYFIDIGVPEDYEKAKRDMPAIFPEGGECLPISCS